MIGDLSDLKVRESIAARETHECEVTAPFHGLVEQTKELDEGSLVHDVHHGHLHYQEVEDGSSGCHWAVLFPGCGDLHLRFRCHN